MPFLCFVNSEKTATALEDTAVLTQEILDGFDYAGEAAIALRGVIVSMIEKGVFYSHRLEGDWESRIRECKVDVTGPVHTVDDGMFTEICIRFDRDKLPIGMQAELEQNEAETFDDF